MTLTEARESWVRSLRVTKSPRTIETYERHVRWFCEFAHGRGVRVLTAMDLKLLRAWIVELVDARGASAHVHALAVHALRSFTRWAHLEELLEHDLGERLEVPKVPRTLPRVLTTEEVLALLQAPPPPPNWYGVRDRAWLSLLFASGLRVSELVSVEHAAVNFSDRSVRVTGKGRKTRIVPVAEACLEQLRRWLHVRPSCEAPNLFVNRRGRPLTRRTFERLVHDYAADAGLPGRVHPHVLRHSFATSLLRGRADLRAVQEMLGHANLGTTEIYTHVDLTHVKEAYERAHPLEQLLTRQRRARELAHPLIGVNGLSAEQAMKMVLEAGLADFPREYVRHVLDRIDAARGRSYVTEDRRGPGLHKAIGASGADEISPEPKRGASGPGPGAPSRSRPPSR